MDTVVHTESKDDRSVDLDLLDPTVIAELSRAIPSQRLIVFSEALRSACHEAIMELRTASCSAEDTVSIAHRIKGMVGNLGLRKLSEIAASLERSETWTSDARLSAIVEFELDLEPSLTAFRVGIKQ